MRFEELRSSIEGLEFVGRGWRGLVYRGNYKDRTLAFKVAISKEKEYAIRKEVDILKRLKDIKGFPQIFLSGEDFLAYEFIEGIAFEKLNLSKPERLKVYLKVLDMAYLLDNMGINKDEFHQLEKNLIIGKYGDVYLLDFERGLVDAKKVHNVTQFMQILRREGLIEISEVIELGRIYRERSEDVYLKLKTLLEGNIPHTL